MSVIPVICVRDYYYVEILEKVFMAILIIKIICISLFYSSCNILVILIIWISLLLRQIYFYNHIISSFINTTNIFFSTSCFQAPNLCTLDSVVTSFQVVHSLLDCDCQGSQFASYRRCEGK